MFTPKGEVVGIDLNADGDGLYSTTYTTTEVGIYLPQLKTEKGTVLLPPISTVTSSEYTQDVTNDKETLSVLSKRTNGLLNPTPQQVMAQEQFKPKVQSLDSLWIWVSIVLLLINYRTQNLDGLIRSFQEAKHTMVVII